MKKQVDKVINVSYRRRYLQIYYKQQTRALMVPILNGLCAQMVQWHVSKGRSSFRIWTMILASQLVLIVAGRILSQKS